MRREASRLREQQELRQLQDSLEIKEKSGYDSGHSQRGIQTNLSDQVDMLTRAVAELVASNKKSSRKGMSPDDDDGGDSDDSREESEHNPRQPSDEYSSRRKKRKKKVRFYDSGGGAPRLINQSWKIVILTEQTGLEGETAGQPFR